MYFLMIVVKCRKEKYIYNAHFGWHFQHVGLNGVVVGQAVGSRHGVSVRMDRRPARNYARGQTDGVPRALVSGHWHGQSSLTGLHRDADWQWFLHPAYLTAWLCSSLKSYDKCGGGTGYWSFFTHTLCCPACTMSTSRSYPPSILHKAHATLTRKRELETCVFAVPTDIKKLMCQPEDNITFRFTNPTEALVRLITCSPLAENMDNLALYPEDSDVLDDYCNGGRMLRIRTRCHQVQLH